MWGQNREDAGQGRDEGKLVTAENSPSRSTVVHHVQLEKNGFSRHTDEAESSLVHPVCAVPY